MKWQEIIIYIFAILKNRQLMKILLVIIFFLLSTLMGKAQIPYFAGTAGDGNLYGYTSIKSRPGQNSQETYTCFQYGIGNQVATGVDIYTGGGNANWGVLARWGKKINPYFYIGGQVTPSFNLNDNFKYSYTTAALYLNGNITRDGKLFWCSNTWWGINRDADNSISNWEFLGYTFGLSNGHGITPMVGCIHDWKFNNEADLTAGVYYSIGKWNVYIWGNDFFKENPRVVIGVDFKLPTKR